MKCLTALAIWSIAIIAFGAGQVREIIKMRTHTAEPGQTITHANQEN